MTSITELTTTPTLQGGYNIERFIDKNAFVNECICSICSNILRDPLVTPCEHVFCSECIQKWLTKRPDISTCPIDRKQLEVSQLMRPSRTFFNLYNNLELKCENSPADYQEIIFLGDITSHQETCLYRFVYCRHEGCNISGQANWVNTHEFTCMHRLQECEQCQVTLKCRDMAKHNDILCPATQVVCNCGKTRPRHLLENHRDNECANTIIECPTIDCTKIIRRGDMATHVAEPKHIMLLYYQASDKYRKRIDTTEKFMEEVKDSLDQIKRDIKEKESETVVSLNNIKLESNKSANYVNWLMRSNSPNTTRYILNGVDSLIKPAIHYENITTPLMYIFPSGVCFCLKIKFEKDVTNQLLMGVYFLIQSGVYDDSIIWPFKKKITVTLVDQQHEGNEARHISNALNAIMEKKTRKYFEKIGRPTKEKNTTITERGWPNFISQRVLRSANNRYVKNDQLYIDICIE